MKEETLGFVEFVSRRFGEGHYDWLKGKPWIDKSLPYGSSGYLERNSKESVWWLEATRLSISGKVSSFLSNPKLGRLYAIESLRRMEILERERMWSLSEKILYVDLVDDKDMLQRFAGRNEIITNIANRVLGGDLPNEEEQKKKFFKYGARGVEGKESYDSLAFHWMIQFSHLRSLPYVGLIPEEEAKRAISFYLEDRLAWCKYLTERNHV